MDYEVYRLSKKEWLLYGSQGIGYLALLDFVFYRSAALFAVLAPMGICYPLILRKDLKRRRKEALKLQFKDAILSAASGLNAGYSVEMPLPLHWRKWTGFMGRIHDIQELRLILAKTRMNRAFGEALGDFARRSGLEDIQNFSEVFLAARKSGGELVRIIARTAEIIAEKIRIQEDIMTATAARRMEQRIMSAIPLLIVFYIELTSPGFFDLLYGTAAGRVVMTVCLGIYLGACSLSKRILEIRI
ncbi:MAG: type II secretion system F family protein [Enterocloster sp.]